MVNGIIYNIKMTVKFSDKREKSGMIREFSSIRLLVKQASAGRLKPAESASKEGGEAGDSDSGNRNVNVIAFLESECFLTN